MQYILLGPLLIAGIICVILDEIYRLLIIMVDTIKEKLRGKEPKKLCPFCKTRLVSDKYLVTTAFTKDFIPEEVYVCEQCYTEIKAELKDILEHGDKIHTGDMIVIKSSRE